MYSSKLRVFVASFPLRARRKAFQCFIWTTSVSIQYRLLVPFWLLPPLHVLWDSFVLQHNDNVESEKIYRFFTDFLQNLPLYWIFFIFFIFFCSNQFFFGFEPLKIFPRLPCRNWCSICSKYPRKLNLANEYVYVIINTYIAIWTVNLFLTISLFNINALLCYFCEKCKWINVT